jgi:hypothetical protein
MRWPRLNNALPRAIVRGFIQLYISFFIYISYLFFSQVCVDGNVVRGREQGVGNKNERETGTGTGTRKGLP